MSGVEKANGMPPLSYSWPLKEHAQHFELGAVLDCLVADSLPADLKRDFRHGAGWWECDLRDNSLTWSDGVYDIFGLPRGAPVSRSEAIALYAEPSRAAMERLRAHAIENCCGFTLDAEIIPVRGKRRWMRLIAAPDCSNGVAVRLHGLKLIL